jgi:hypothetical protein
MFIQLLVTRPVTQQYLNFVGEIYVASLPPQKVTLLLTWQYINIMHSYHFKEKQSLGRKKGEVYFITCYEGQEGE